MRRISLALLIVVLFVFSAGAFEIKNETVDEGSTQGYHSSLVIDEDGNPHISFMADSQVLKYAHFDGDEWITEKVVEGAGYINETSITLNAEGYPCIAFQKGVYPNSSVMFTSFNGSTWDTVIVDQGYYDTGKILSLAVDNNGNPGIAYVYHDSSDSSNSLKFAKRENGSWVPDMVNSDDNFHTNKCTLAFSSVGVPFIGYGFFTDIDNYGNDCKMYYSWLDETGEWQMELVDPTDESGLGTSTMALDNNDNPHFVYSANDDSSLKYAFKNGEGFSFLTVDSGEDIGYYSSLIVDDSNIPHLAYCAFSGESDLKYGVLEDGSWVTSFADSQGDVGTFPSIALDPSGNPSISYLEADDYDLQYACKNDEEWDVQTVPIEGKRRGSYPEIALDSKGEPSMVYMLQNTRAVLFASKNGDKWEKSTIISFEDLDSGHYLKYPSFIIDDNDIAHLLFVSDDVLTYATQVNDTWQFEAISPDLDTTECDLAIDISGKSNVAFTAYDYESTTSGSTARDIFYAEKMQSGWSVEKVDDGEIYSPEIAVDKRGNISILFYDNYAKEIRYGKKVEGSWDISHVASNDYYYGLSHAVDSVGIPHIAFVDRPQPLHDAGSASYSGELIHGTLLDGEWILEKVDDIENVHGLRQISLTFDPFDNPHITYGTSSAELVPSGFLEEDEKAGLKYAWYDGDSWNTGILAKGYSDSFATYSSLGLDDQGLPHVAYFTGTGVDYLTLVPEKEDVLGNGGTCSLGLISPALGLLLLPLVLLFRSK